jgi:hypothetical protein
MIKLLNEYVSVTKNKIDIAIFDEVHKTRNVESGGWINLVKISNLYEKMYGFSATITHNMKYRYQYYYGKVIYKKNYYEMIENKYIRDYEIRICDDPRAKYYKVNEGSVLWKIKYNIKRVTETLIVNNMKNAIIYCSYSGTDNDEERYRTKRVSNFERLNDEMLNNLSLKLEIKHSNKFNMKINIHKIYGNTPMNERLKIFELFKNSEGEDFNIIINCRTLSEGIDLPGADVELFSDTKVSIINIIQCVGRVTRQYSDKKSIIILPHDINTRRVYKGNKDKIKTENMIRTMSGIKYFKNVDIDDVYHDLSINPFISQFECWYSHKVDNTKTKIIDPYSIDCRRAIIIAIMDYDRTKKYTLNKLDHIIKLLTSITGYYPLYLENTIKILSDTEIFKENDGYYSLKTNYYTSQEEYDIEELIMKELRKYFNNKNKRNYVNLDFIVNKRQKLVMIN